MAERGNGGRPTAVGAADGMDARDFEQLHECASAAQSSCAHGGRIPLGACLSALEVGPCLWVAAAGLSACACSGR